MEKNRSFEPFHSFILIAVIMIIFIGVQLVSLMLFQDDINLMSIVSEIFGMGLPVVLFMLFTRRAKQHMFMKKTSMKNIAIISSSILLFIPVSMLIATANMWIVENTIGLTPGLQDTVVISNLQEYLIAIVVMCIVPAICEEFAFRTLFMSGLGKLGKMPAFLFVSLFFSLAHMIPEKLLTTFALSMLLCWFVYRTGSLWASVTAHFVNNFAAVTITYITTLVPDGAGEPDLLEVLNLTRYTASFILWGGLTVLFLPIIIILFKSLMKNTQDTKLNFEKVQKFDSNTTAAFLPALAVFILLLSSIVLVNIFSAI